MVTAENGTTLTRNLGTADSSGARLLRARWVPRSSGTISFCTALLLGWRSLSFIFRSPIRWSDPCRHSRSMPLDLWLARSAPRSSGITAIASAANRR